MVELTQDEKAQELKQLANPLDAELKREAHHTDAKKDISFMQV